MLNVKQPSGKHAVTVPATPDAKTSPSNSKDQPISLSQDPPPTATVMPVPEMQEPSSMVALGS